MPCAWALTSGPPASSSGPSSSAWASPPCCRPPSAAGEIGGWGRASFGISRGPGAWGVFGGETRSTDGSSGTGQLRESFWKAAPKRRWIRNKTRHPKGKKIEQGEGRRRRETQGNLGAHSSALYEKFTLMVKQQSENCWKRILSFPNVFSFSRDSPELIILLPAWLALCAVTINPHLPCLEVCHILGFFFHN